MTTATRKRARTTTAIDNSKAQEQFNKFWAKYRTHVKPFTKYSEYFTTRSVDLVIREFKNNHKRLVIESNWSEQKFVLVAHNILTRNYELNRRSFEMSGMLFEKGLLKDLEL